MAGAGVWSYSSAGNLDSMCLGALDQLPCDCSAAHCAVCTRMAAIQSEDAWPLLLISKSHLCAVRRCSNRSTCASERGI